MSVHAEVIPFDSLEIIRGETLWRSSNGDERSLFVALNYNIRNSTNSLKELRMPRLRGEQQYTKLINIL